MNRLANFSVGEIIEHAHGRNGLGEIVEIFHGCNLLYKIKFYNSNFYSILPESDIIKCDIFKDAT